MDTSSTSAALSPPLRVLIVARQPITRSGLRGLLAEADDAIVVDQAAGIEQATLLASEQRPDAVLAAWEGRDGDDVVALADRLGALGIPLVLFGDTPSPGEFDAALRAGVRGFVLSDAAAEEIGAALDAVVRGLLVLDPALVPSLPGIAPAAMTGNVTALETLTEREGEVLQLLALGLPNKAIARRLSITEHTVKFHVGSILAKLGAASRTEAVTRAARQGILAL